LVDIEPDAQTTTSLNFFLPIDDTGSFDRELIKNRANSLGKIEFGAVAFNPSGGQPSTPFNGVLGPDNPFATLTFKVNPDLEPPQQAIIAVVHTPGETTDTNLVELQSASDILAIANSLILTIP
ncbi:hypothetical protein GTO10_03455, partial [Candidatus Saccharibacteria bacterium]|nr:hypothetical protein [Candidatus Saccharibacteria bacterium]